MCCKTLYHMDLNEIEIDVEVWPHKVQKYVWWLSVLGLLRNRRNCDRIFDHSELTSMTEGKITKQSALSKLVSLWNWNSATSQFSTDDVRPYPVIMVFISISFNVYDSESFKILNFGLEFNFFYYLCLLCPSSTTEYLLTYFSPSM